jgi:hypothetical protein
MGFDWEKPDPKGCASADFRASKTGDRRQFRVQNGVH